MKIGSSRGRLSQALAAHRFVGVGPKQCGEGGARVNTLLDGKVEQQRLRLAGDEAGQRLAVTLDGCAAKQLELNG